MQTGADILLEILKEVGVHTVFGIPSIHNLGFYEALRKDGSVRHILCRHETTATHMADGYARESGTPGVVITSTGPGAGYAVPALQEAYGSSSPVLMITTNIAASKIGKGLGTLHEVKEQDGIFKNITKAVFIVRAEEDIENLTWEALNILHPGRPGPVYLEVPTDLMNREIGGKRDLRPSKTVQQTDLPDLKEAITLIKNAQRPLLVVGTAAVRACMAEEVVSLAETLAAPVIFTPSARGLIPDKHPLALGNSARSGTIRETASSSDLALAIGTRLREVDTKRRGLVLPHLIHVDWDNEWTDRNFPSNISLSGDMPGIVRALMEALESPLDRELRLQRVHEISLKIGDNAKGFAVDNNDRKADPVLQTGGQFLGAVKESPIPDHGQDRFFRRGDFGPDGCGKGEPDNGRSLGSHPPSGDMAGIEVFGPVTKLGVIDHEGALLGQYIPNDL